MGTNAFSPGPGIDEGHLMRFFILFALLSQGFTAFAFTESDSWVSQTLTEIQALRANPKTLVLKGLSLKDNTDGLFFYENTGIGENTGSLVKKAAPGDIAGLTGDRH